MKKFLYTIAIVTFVGSAANAGFMDSLQGLWAQHGDKVKNMASSLLGSSTPASDTSKATKESSTTAEKKPTTTASAHTEAHEG